MAAAVALATALAVAAPARADDEGDLPARQKILLLLRVLAYDRNLKTRAGESAGVAILHRAGNERSEACRRELSASLEEVAASSVVSGLAIQPRSLAWAGPAALDAALAPGRTSALFVCPGLEDWVPAIRAAARRRSTFTASAGRTGAEGGLSLGLVKRDGHAVLVVNLEASRAEGVDLDSTLLRIAEVIREAAPAVKAAPEPKLEPSNLPEPTAPGSPPAEWP